MGFAVCFLRLLTFLVALFVPTIAAVHVVATSGQGVKAVERASQLVEYFLLVCCLQYLMTFYPLAALGNIIPQSIQPLMQLVVAVGLAIPAFNAVPRLYSFGLAHYEEYLRSAIRFTEDKVLNSVKNLVQNAMDAAKARVQ